MMTPKQLRQALGDIGRAVSARQLTDWRAKGLLPPLKRGRTGTRTRSSSYINQSRYANRVTEIFEFCGGLIVSYELDIRRALEQQKFFNVDYPVVAAKLEFLKERVSELWKSFWTDLSNGGDDRKHVC
jgi:hypothetical protein